MILINEKAVKSQSKARKSDSATVSLVIVLWLLLQSFERFFLTVFHLQSYFCVNISVKF